MQLAHRGLTEPQGPVWWCVAAKDNVRDPIVGVEVATGRSRSVQWLLSDRGVRCYAYGNGRLTFVGAPLATNAFPDDFDQARRWLQHYLPEIAPGHRLPVKAVAGLGGMSEVVDLLRACWRQRLIDPPAGMSFYEIAYEIESFPHGVVELLEATEAMGW